MGASRSQMQLFRIKDLWVAGWGLMKCMLLKFARRSINLNLKIVISAGDFFRAPNQQARGSTYFEKGGRHRTRPLSFSMNTIFILRILKQMHFYYEFCAKFELLFMSKFISDRPTRLSAVQRPISI
jgi:hypothetical protein